MDTPRRLPDGTAGDWIRPRLLAWHGDGVPAGGVVPTGFDRIVRVLHPAGDGRSWAEVAAASGTRVHPLAQWACLSPGFDGTGRSGDVDPEEGSIPAETLAAVLDHCPAEGEVFHAVWEGFGTWDVPEVGVEGLLLLPHREYRVFAGPRAAFTSWPGMGESWPQSANLVWPADRSWCIATEIDWDSTLVACSAEVAAALLADPRLESFEVAAEDDLSWLGDTVNARPAWLERNAHAPEKPAAYVAGLVLAAGGGRRMGGPKALVRSAPGSPTWVEQTVCRVAGSGVGTVVVVVGAEAESVIEVLMSGAWALGCELRDGAVVEVVEAEGWESGMAVSLRDGIEAASALPEVPDVLMVTLVDLPDVDEAVYTRMGQEVTRAVADGAGATGILARAGYAGVPGHPVLIGRDHWAGVVQRADGDRGARGYLASHDVVLVECGDLATGRDVDRVEDGRAGR